MVEVLTVDVIFSIMKWLNPVSVLSFCQVNRHLAQIARNEKLFRSLVLAHYPEVTLSDRPKGQYITCAGLIGVNYSIGINHQKDDRARLTFGNIAEVDEKLMFHAGATLIRNVWE